MLDRFDTPGGFGQGGVAPLRWAEFAVRLVNKDFLTCRAWDGTAIYGVDVLIAKDPELRQRMYDGITVEHPHGIGQISYAYTGTQARTATRISDSSTRDQIIIPPYIDEAATGDHQSIIRAVPTLTRVKDDAGVDLFCQWCEFTNRAWANVEVTPL